MCRLLLISRSGSLQDCFEAVRPAIPSAIHCRFCFTRTEHRHVREKHQTGRLCRHRRHLAGVAGGFVHRYPHHVRRRLLAEYGASRAVARGSSHVCPVPFPLGVGRRVCAQQRPAPAVAVPAAGVFVQHRVHLYAQQLFLFCPRRRVSCLVIGCGTGSRGRFAGAIPVV